MVQANHRSDRTFMANAAHVEILRSGVPEWNLWREKNAAVRPDLDAADLHSCALQGANLTFANLIETDLTHSSLHGAYLTGADLSGADLSDANLSGAGLQEANLSWAKLLNTNLSGADLRLANFHGADARAANFHGAHLGETLLVDTDLTEVKDLDTCIHWAPVSLDHRTFLRSGHMPASFLRRCGTPEELIEQLPLVFSQSEQQCLTFIVSTQEDQAFSNHLSQDLQTRGIRCWVQNKQTRDGFDVKLEEILRNRRRYVILVLSRHALAADWVHREVETVIKAEKRLRTRLLIPVQVDRLILTKWADDIKAEHNIVDFKVWKEPNSYKRALASLIETLQSGPASAPAPILQSATVS